MNLTKIEKQLDIVQKKCRARTITIEDINQFITRLENRLKNIMLKKDWQGLIFYIDIHAQNFPSAYKFTPESTVFILERKKTTWDISGIKRWGTATNSVYAKNLMDEKYQKAMTKFLLNNFWG